MIQHLDTMTLQAIHRLDLAKYVPIHGSATFEEIAAYAQIDEPVMCRLLRFAMTNHIFHEEPVGVVRHTLLSRRLAEDSVVRGAVGMLVEESYPGSAKVCHCFFIFLWV